VIIGIVLRGRFWEVVMGTRGGGSFGSKMGKQIRDSGLVLCSGWLRIQKFSPELHFVSH
jgi:hypothetical protein